MKKIFIVTILLSVAFILTGCGNSPVVKKSNNDICHKKGALFYENTKNFTAYDSIEECLNSGGRLPKRQ